MPCTSVFELNIIRYLTELLGVAFSLFSYNISLYDCCTSFIHPTVYGYVGLFPRF